MGPAAPSWSVATCCPTSNASPGIARPAPRCAACASPVTHWREAVPIPIVLAAVDVESEVDTYRYGLVLTFTSGPRGEEMLDRHPDRVLARVAGARVGTLHEVIEADAARVLMRMLTDGTRLTGRDGIFDAASQGPAVLADHEPYALMPTTLGQTVITCGAAAELKIRRRLLPGRSHEQLLLGALAHNLDVELPMAYASLDLLTPDNRRWPFMLLRVAGAVHRGRVGAVPSAGAAMDRRTADDDRTGRPVCLAARRS